VRTGPTASANIDKVPAQATVVSRNGCNLPRLPLLVSEVSIMRMSVGVGPFRFYSGSNRRRRPRSGKQREADAQAKAIAFVWHLPLSLAIGSSRLSSCSGPYFCWSRVSAHSWWAS
jgi:hypothetical protein